MLPSCSLKFVLLTVFWSSCTISSFQAGPSAKQLILNETRSPRIIGGLDATSTELPFMALIRLFDSPISIMNRKLCGAAIINPNWIVTSAQCSQNPRRNYRVSAGNPNANFPDIVNEQSRKIQQILIHPNFNFTSLQNDIALWRVFPPFVLSGTGPVNSIPYARYNYVANGTGIVAGWGERNDNDPNGSSILQRGIVNIMPNTQCQTITQQSGIPIQITDGHICADAITTGDVVAGPCKGDRGGPLMSVKDGGMILTGIVSGTWNCTRTGPPRLYTRIATHYDWIRLKTG